MCLMGFALLLWAATLNLAADTVTNSFLPAMPDGCFLHAYDDCGMPHRQPHVLTNDCYLWTFNTSDTEAGIKERVYMWRSGTAMWRERPLLGWGPGGVKREYSRYALPEAFKKRTGHVHNTPLQILVERGVLGLATWLAIWIAFYLRAIGLLRALAANQTHERALVAGSVAAVTGFLVSGLSEYNFDDSEVVMVAWAVMALPWAAARGSGLTIQH